jgi:acyl-lipid omega-6 desaturase (Delta-12 desaturase)
MTVVMVLSFTSFENVYWARHEVWDPMRVALEGRSYSKLPKVLQWLTGNIGLHHIIHHARPTVPNYYLQQCYDEAPPFRSVAPLTIRNSTACAGAA